MATQQQIDSFSQFATEQIKNGGAELSIDELYQMWRASHPSAEELADGVKAVKAALADMENGDRGISADEHLANLRRKYNIAETE